MPLPKRRVHLCTAMHHGKKPHCCHSVQQEPVCLQNCLCLFFGIPSWLLLLWLAPAQSWVAPSPSRRRTGVCPFLLSDAYLENDLVAVVVVDKNGEANANARLCAVRYDGTVAPLCIRADDVETDLYVDPREYAAEFWTTGVTDEAVTGTYGEGFYGQRPIPSLGGGPGCVTTLCLL